MRPSMQPCGRVDHGKHTAYGERKYGKPRHRVMDRGIVSEKSGGIETGRTVSVDAAPPMKRFEPSY